MDETQLEKLLKVAQALDIFPREFLEELRATTGTLQPEPIRFSEATFTPTAYRTACGNKGLDHDPATGLYVKCDLPVGHDGDHMTYTLIKWRKGQR